MMIFDGFPDMDRARTFARRVKETFALACEVRSEQDDALDPFPYVLVPPIVYVPRTKENIERAIERLAPQEGGRFAGT